MEEKVQESRLLSGPSTYSSIVVSSQVSDEKHQDREKAKKEKHLRWQKIYIQ